jgi:hypothetical protein
MAVNGSISGYKQGMLALKNPVAAEAQAKANLRSMATVAAAVSGNVNAQTQVATGAWLTPGTA